MFLHDSKRLRKSLRKWQQMYTYNQNQEKTAENIGNEERALGKLSREGSEPFTCEASVGIWWTRE